MVFCFFQVIQLLSAFSADMGVMDMEDCTPLHFAAVTGDVNCCKFLAQRGAVNDSKHIKHSINVVNFSYNYKQLQNFAAQDLKQTYCLLLLHLCCNTFTGRKLNVFYIADFSMCVWGGGSIAAK